VQTSESELIFCGNEFSGQVNWVQVDLGKDDHDHLISPERRFRIAMARQ